MMPIRWDAETVEAYTDMAVESLARDLGLVGEALFLARGELLRLTFAKSPLLCKLWNDTHDDDAVVITQPRGGVM